MNSDFELELKERKETQESQAGAGAPATSPPSRPECSWCGKECAPIPRVGWEEFMYCVECGAVYFREKPRETTGPTMPVCNHV